MCGILGQITFNNSKFLLPDLNLIQHRGPDGIGEWFNSHGNVYFGHTRLAILEPTPAGQQPMSDSSGRFTLIFNGEIYNHLKLRSLLPAVNWRGSSDTETLVELLAVKGLDALPLLKGMFAFALHDIENNSVLLVRDRLGIKPLWVHSKKNIFSFSSEVRALLQPGKSTLSTQALSEYISFGRMPNIGEIIEGINAVPPGSWIKVLKNGELKKKRWWPNGDFHSLKPKSQQECVQRINQLVDTAIQEHLISDVGIGSFLSGGIDSSIVTLVAGKVLGKNLRSFTVGFPDNSLDERVIARKVARQAGSEHCELEINEDSCLSWVKEAVTSLDLPSVDAINTYIVSKAVRDTGLKVALSGLGGDELFGGYPSFKNVPLLNWLHTLPIGISKKLISYMPASIREKLAGLTNFTTTDLTITRRRLTSVASLSIMGLSNGMPVVPPALNRLDVMGQISWAEIQGYMIPMLLRDSDQMSMAVGLEIRVPYLDHQLVEDVLSLNQKYKKGKGVKSLLVDAFRADLPVEVYDRPKQGFVLPMNTWIRGPLAQFVNEGVHSAADHLHLQEPLNQKDRFDNKILHWTRVWKWCVLGHWLTNKNVTSPVS